jgi:putative exporter of polyketide antibiotics
MENQKVNTTKSAMTYGLILALGLIVFHLLQYIMDVYKPPTWVSLLNYAIIIGGIVYGTIRFRNDELGGYISYGRSLGMGVLISVFASIVYGFYFYLLTAVIDPGYMENVFKMLEETYLEMGMDYDQVETTMGMVKKFQTPLLMVLSNVFGFTFIGTIFSLIVSIFIKKEEPLFETNE